MDERERLIEIMNSQGVTAKQFSLELGISAGTLSNIIGGRNKPSLELLKSIAAHYPFIESDWLFLGKGEMYKSNYESSTAQSFHSEPDLFSHLNTAPPVSTTRSHTQNSSISSSNITPSSKEEMALTSSPRTVQRIIIFYSDGTFEER